ncbi:MAG: CRTAC1 family protein, partial [Bacteroidota bacterium]
MRNLYLIALIIIIGCDSRKLFDSQFKEVHQEAGVDFINQLDYTEKLNPYTFRNFYNGGGVALGDINNDGLIDIYLTGNLVNNRLFLNKGNWKFEDITLKAGVSCSEVWSTGATFIDINTDGFLDLYVCKSGPPGGKNRNNELFINNGDLTFSESAKTYGLDVTGLSVQSAFFDYDKDGDLDCYLLTNSIRSVGNYDLVEGAREIPNPEGNKFFINEGGKFIDVSTKVGIYTSNIGFGLGITLGDFNNDGWTDMFVSNDFFERDYLYLNDQAGGFKESLEKYIDSISMGSMGADAADLNNDSRLDLMVTEMLPDSLSRTKTKAVYENWEKYQMNVTKGYHHQFPRNTLQRGFGSSFMEIGRFSGVSASEWSWGALIFDINNDGLKDVFVSNGIYKDLLDRDYLNYTATDEQIRQMMNAKENVITKLVDQMPSRAIPNYMFLNRGGLRFENVADSIGMDAPSFSNGSAYGDLDNDGDLDLVVNNVNQPAFLFENNLDTSVNRSLNISFKSNGKNTFEIGTKVVAYASGKQLEVDNYTIRGFQSSIAPTVSLGVGNTIKIDSVKIIWPNLGCSTLYDVPTNRQIEIKRKQKGTDCKHLDFEDNSLFKKSAINIDVKHQENNFSEFNRERLLISMQSNEGPHLEIIDLDENNCSEILMSGAKYQASQEVTGSKASAKLNLALKKYSISEDVDLLFFDADSDGDMDLYVARGGRAFSRSSSALQDILLLNTNEGFVEGERLPFKSFVSSSSVAHGDYDGDGDQDLFIGERSNPFIYGLGGRGYLFSNDGNGVFEDNSQLLPGIDSIGMVKDATWKDINN